MRGHVLWYGYLEAGDKSSPVVFDRRLDTGNAETIYLFNLQRDTIVPYKRVIVDAKLRELGSDDTALIERLKSAYARARRRSGLRLRQATEVPARPADGSAPAARPEPQEPALEYELDPELDAVWGEEP